MTSMMPLAVLDTDVLSEVLKPKFLRCKGEFQLLFREDGGQWGVTALSTA
jgi:hypothetical protein